MTENYRAYRHGNEKVKHEIRAQQHAFLHRCGEEIVHYAAFAVAHHNVVGGERYGYARGAQNARYHPTVHESVDRLFVHGTRGKIFHKSVCLQVAEEKDVKQEYDYGRQQCEKNAQPVLEEHAHTTAHGVTESEEIGTESLHITFPLP